ncbi:cobalamin biosynthesis protein [Catenovulum sp. 2E275]|uniref:cobalamin biosynthesis protein CobD/CbiB n=1 Tax=Catenovulum sp. 2E275 TaxID=2980497 RepID=UPI0021D108BB|nr:cobalamin biosynthesis protein [Catenovulum sp. 2E275]MCU4676694.1 cobalamin biosynthesis protein [Catenovulum sp. 2E275]
MTELLANLPDFPDYVIRVLILFVALVLDWKLPISDKYHPVYFFRQVVERLADKVHPDPKRHKSQLQISGTLALISAILPVMIILYLFMPLVEVSWFIDIIVVWVCLSYQHCALAHQKIAQALFKGKKYLARDRLSDWVLRDTDNLSELGIVKASIENQVLRSGYFYHAIIFWYLLAGPVFVLGFRLLLELNQSWNAKQARFFHFAQPTKWLLHILAWLPLRLFALSLCLNWQQLKQVIKLNAKNWRFSNSLAALAAASICLKVQLGGAVSYASVKLRRVQLTQYRLAKAADIGQIDKFLRRSARIWLIIIVISASLVMIWHHYFSS